MNSITFQRSSSIENRVEPGYDQFKDAEQSKTPEKQEDILSDQENYLINQTEKKIKKNKQAKQQWQLLFFSPFSNLLFSDFDISKTEKKIKYEQVTRAKQIERQRSLSNKVQKRQSFLSELINDDKKHFSLYSLDSNSQQEQEQRAQIIDAMAYICHVFQLNSRVFFLQVTITDMYCKSQKDDLTLDEMKLTNICILYIANKFDQNSNTLDLNSLNQMLNWSISKEQIMEKEIEILKCLNFEILSTQFYQIFETVMQSLDLQKYLNKQDIEFIEVISQIFCKMAITNYDLISSQPFYIIISASIYLSLKNLSNLKKDLFQKQITEKLLLETEVEPERLVEVTQKLINIYGESDKQCPIIKGLNDNQVSLLYQAYQQ